MNKNSAIFFFLLASLIFMQCQQVSQIESAPHIVFVMGEEEYRSEESMPMLAKILHRDLGAKISLCYSVDSVGFIDPNTIDHIQGLEALESADMMVLFTRWRTLPTIRNANDSQFCRIG